MITKQAGYGAEADWWSAGVMLYEMVHGYTPFTASGTIDAENAVLPQYRICLTPAQPMKGTR